MEIYFDRSRGGKIMSIVRTCEYCNEEFYTESKNSKRKYCSSKCRKEARKKKLREEKELDSEPILDFKMEDIPPKEHFTVKTGNEKRKDKPVSLLFLCNQCIIKKYNPIKKKLIVPGHQLLGTYYGKCPSCGKEVPFNPEMSANMRAFVRIPPKDEAPLNDDDIRACKKIYKHYAVVSRNKLYGK
nr:MAG: hypothetical protein [Lokiarchaeota virus Ratatoskr Meg22_1012]